MNEPPEKRRPNSAIFISTRVRLARNLAGRKFVNSLSFEELSDVLDFCEGALSGVRKLCDGRFFRMGEIPEAEREMLVEDRLASRELAENCRARGLFVSADRSCAVMVNEEDHLRIQAFAGGLNLAGALRAANSVDDGFEKTVKYAFSPAFGYLTACPTNAGTGLRASVMMHLPALALSDLMDKVVRGLGQLGICVRGASGEGSDSYGSFFQISNQQTLGLSESDIIKKISKFVKKVAEFEINARAKLSSETPLVLADKFARARAVLASCKLIDTAEAVSALSHVRLMADMSSSPKADGVIKAVDEAAATSMPSHLSARFGLAGADSGTRDELRAAMLNEFAKNLPEL